MGFGAAALLASRAKAGGPDGTRTCNHTVMSGRISISFVDFTAVSAAFDRIRCFLMRTFLVRNWCGALERPKVQALCSHDFRTEALGSLVRQGAALGP